MANTFVLFCNRYNHVIWWNDQQRSNGKEKYLLMWEVVAPRNQYGLVWNFFHFSTKACLQRCWTFWELENRNLDNSGNADYNTFRGWPSFLPQIPLVSGEELALSNLQFKRGQFQFGILYCTYNSICQWRQPSKQLQ